MRGTLPSVFDCHAGYMLGLVGGQLAVSPVLNKFVAASVFIQDPTLPAEKWQCEVWPSVVAAAAFGLGVSEKGAPQKPSTEAVGSALQVQLRAPTVGRACRSIDADVQSLWLSSDLYLNSGPMQFPAGASAEADARSNFLLSGSRV